MSQSLEQTTNVVSDGSQDYFMSIALVTALRSNDPSTKVGACIVNEDGKIVGIGYNRLTKNMFGLETGTPSNSKLKKDLESDDIVHLSMWLHSKYPYIVYADMDAILSKTCSSLKGCTLYTLLYPWHESAKLIVESGIKEVIYYSDKHRENAWAKAAENIFDHVDIKVRKFKVEKDENIVVLQFLASRTVEIP